MRNRCSYAAHPLRSHFAIAMQSFYHRCANAAQILRKLHNRSEIKAQKKLYLCDIAVQSMRNSSAIVEQSSAIVAQSKRNYCAHVLKSLRNRITIAIAIAIAIIATLSLRNASHLLHNLNRCDRCAIDAQPMRNRCAVAGQSLLLTHAL
jgi:hypothetical protein